MKQTGLIILAILAAGLLRATASLAQAPATAPTTAPSTEADIHRAIIDLADPDPDVRDQARSNLMGLTLADLPTLKRVAVASKPLLPGQVAALRDVVQQVYLAGEQAQAMAAAADLHVSPMGFIGLSWTATGGPVSNDQGIVVVDRIPGFCGYRMLQNGDIIEKILDRPDLDISSITPFQEAILNTPPGTTVHLQVLRHGQVTTIPLTLDAKPLALQNNDSVANEMAQRIQRFDDYWTAEFAPAVE